MVNLKNNIRKIRESQGMTRKSLSLISGVPIPTLIHYENQDVMPSLFNLALIRNAFGCTFEDLVSVEENFDTK